MSKVRLGTAATDRYIVPAAEDAKKRVRSISGRTNDKEKLKYSDKSCPRVT
jgi:hypothetical protein